MNKVAYCGPSGLDPVVLRPAQLEAIGLLKPTLDFAVSFQRLLSAASIYLALRTYLLAAIAVSWTAFASKVVAIFTLRTLRAVVLQTARGVATVYKTKTVRRIRKRLEFEIGMLILGPGTNAMIVMVFWPGWWFIAGAAVAAKVMVG